MFVMLSALHSGTIRTTFKAVRGAAVETVSLATDPTSFITLVAYLGFAPASVGLIVWRWDGGSLLETSANLPTLDGPATLSFVCADYSSSPSSSAAAAGAFWASSRSNSRWRCRSRSRSRSRYLLRSRSISN